MKKNRNRFIAEPAKAIPEDHLFLNRIISNPKIRGTKIKYIIESMLIRI